MRGDETTCVEKSPWKFLHCLHSVGRWNERSGKGKESILEE